MSLPRFQLGHKPRPLSIAPPEDPSDLDVDIDLSLSAFQNRVLEDLTDRLTRLDESRADLAHALAHDDYEAALTAAQSVWQRAFLLRDVVADARGGGAA